VTSTHRRRTHAVIALQVVVLVLATQLTGAAAANAPAPLGSDDASSLHSDEFHELPSESERILQDTASALGEDFAGAWLDPEAGAISIGFAGDSAVDEARRDTALSSLLSDTRVQIVARDFALAELDAVMEGVSKRLNELLATPPPERSWPFRARVNVQANVVDVDIDPNYSASLTKVRSVLEGEISRGIVRLAVTPVQEDLKACVSRVSCTPYRGGIEIQNDQAFPICTSGFLFRTWSGTRHLTTAEHCVTTVHRHAGARVGPRVWGRDSGNVDGRVIALDNQDTPLPSNVIYRASNNATPITTKISTPSSSLHNNYLCSEGTVGGARCGVLLSYNATYQGRPGFGQISNTACPGDSGAPIVNNATNRAYGLLTGGPAGCNGPNLFTWTAYIESASGYSLLLTQGPELGKSQTLYPNQFLLADANGFVVRMQSDGNLVIVAPGNVPVWGTGTYGHPGTVAKMQSDGNFVLYAPGNIPIWATGTSGSGGVRLLMQNDRNLVIYRANGTAAWASGTGI
jgi:hypothetical protein